MLKGDSRTVLIFICRELLFSSSEMFSSIVLNNNTSTEGCTRDQSGVLFSYATLRMGWLVRFTRNLSEMPEEDLSLNFVNKMTNLIIFASKTFHGMNFKNEGTNILLWCMKLKYRVDEVASINNIVVEGYLFKFKVTMGAISWNNSFCYFEKQF